MIATRLVIRESVNKNLLGATYADSELQRRSLWGLWRSSPSQPLYEIAKFRALRNLYDKKISKAFNYTLRLALLQFFVQCKAFRWASHVGNVQLNRATPTNPPSIIHSN